MSSGKVDLSAALRRLAERRIEDAMAEGKFDNLPGAGQPIELDPAPADEDARATWWAIRILRQNDVTPHEVTMRRTIESLKGQLASASSEDRVRTLARQVNAMVQKLNTLGTNAIRTPVFGVDEQDQVARFRERCRGGDPLGPPTPGNPP